MPSIVEQIIGLRDFEGVIRAVDRTVLGPQYLRESQNFYPDSIGILSKRRGYELYLSRTTFATKIIGDMRRVYDTAGVRYLYWVEHQAAAVDRLVSSTNDAGGVAVHSFASTAKADYGMATYGGVLYVGNDAEAIVRVPFGGAAASLGSLTSFTDGSAAPTLTNDTGAQILNGTYAYAWAVYNHTTKAWTQRSQARLFTKAVASDQHVSIPVATGFVLANPTQERLHLFVSPINYPVELAHDQTPEGVDGGGGGGGIASPVILRQIIADGQPLPLRGTERRGNILAAHRGRIFISGDAANPFDVYATNVLLPWFDTYASGLDVYSPADFYPAKARLPRFLEPVVGIGVCAIGRDDPSAPLAILTQERAHLLYGDILDDPNAFIVEISSEAGCASRRTVVQTPIGLLYAGWRSVYLIPPGGGGVVDIGWPIEPEIRAVGSGIRSEMFATYHKGFYKLTIPSAGATTADIEWWLDLRRGIGSVPSWWGPMRLQVGWTAGCIGTRDTAENDRRFVAIAPFLGTPVVVVVTTDKPNVYNEADPLAGTLSSAIRSRIRTPALASDNPFLRKIYTRFRATGRAATDTSLAVQPIIDGGLTPTQDPMTFSGTAGATWNSGIWDSASWGAEDTFSEGESICEGDRPRGRYIELALEHNVAAALDIRDIEIRHLPVGREVVEVKA